MPVVPFIPVIAAVVGGGMAMAAANKKAKSDMEIAKMNRDANQANSGGVMPLADGDAIQAAKKQSIMDQISGRGRASTLLSDTTNDKLGGG